MLKLIYQKTAARIKHSILIQQPAQILNAEVIFSRYIIGYSYCLRIKPHFLNKGTIHGFPRKTQNNIRVIELILFFHMLSTLLSSN
ncbi:hypothetical protein D3C78_1146700 [compost metagenome]